MRLHIDWPWSEDVRRYGAPARVYIHTKHWLWMVGLWPSIKGQVWTGSEGYTDRYRWIVRHPRLRYHLPGRCNGREVVVTSSPNTYGSGATIHNLKVIA